VKAFPVALDFRLHVHRGPEGFSSRYLDGDGFLGIGAILVRAGLAIDKSENQQDNAADEWHEGNENPVPAAARVV